METKETKRRIDSCDIVSFDVFDTLITRPFRRASDLPVYIGRSNSAPSYPSRRNRLMTKARVRSFLEGNGGEIKASALSTLDLFKTESAFESSCVRPDSKAKELYDYALAKGKRVIIVSDMYFPKTFIADLLAKCGYTDYERLFVSSEFGRTKFTGSLFKVVEKELGIKDRSKILHIGNDWNSDYGHALVAGWHAVHFTPSIERFLEQEQRLRLLNSRKLDVSMALGLMQTHFAGKSEPDDYWQDFGYTYGGPVVYSFVRNIQKIVERKGIDKVVFIARDGYLPKLVFDSITGLKDKSYYVYAQRTICTSCNVYTYRKYPAVGNLRRDSILNFLNHYKDEVPCGTDSLDTFEKAKKALDANMGQYQKLAARSRDAYRRYLHKVLEIDPNETRRLKVLCIDVDSAYKSAQNLITETLKDVADVEGHYFWFVPGLSDPHGTSQFIPLVDAAPTPHAFGVFCEFLMSSAEQKVLGLDENFQPIYKKNPTKSELYRAEIYAKVTEGTKRYCDEFAATFGDADGRFALTDAHVADFMKLFCAIPSKRDIPQFSRIEQSYLNDVRNASISPVPLWKHFVRK